MDELNNQQEQIQSIQSKVKTVDELNIIYNEFIKWKVAPKKGDSPRSISEFAKRYDLTKSDLEEFVNRTNYHNDILKMTLLWAKTQVPELFHKVLEEAKETAGKSNAAEKFIDMIVELDKAQKSPDRSNENNSSNTFIFNLNDDKFKQIAERIARRTGVLEDGGEERSSDIRTINE